MRPCPAIWPNTSIVQADVLMVQKFEILFFAGGRIAVHRIFIAFAKKADVVGILQIFHPYGYRPNFL